MEADKVLAIIRRLRHDYGNHFQVISGYAQLGMLEPIQEYLQSVTEEIRAERIIFESVDADAALYLYTQLLKARDQGIILRYEDLVLKQSKLLEERDEPCHSLTLLVQEMQAEEEELVYLSIYEDEQGIDLFFSWGDQPQNDKNIRINWE